MAIVKIIFWFSLITVIYTYFGYPAWMAFITKFGNKPVRKQYYLPTVSLVISAYNEEKHIENKIKNSISLDYPKEKLEIIVVSDGSTDKTVSILEKYAGKGVTLIKFEERAGKTKAQNEAVKNSKGDILFFTDVTTIHPPDVIKNIAQNFADKTVGCVTGKAAFIPEEQNIISKGADLRLRYELFLRARQSSNYSLFGATGCIYAIRKALYEPLREDLVSDFVEPLMILEKGYRTVYEPTAIAIIGRKVDLQREFVRRRRVIHQGLAGLFYMKRLLNPFRYGFLSISLISHRLLRWLMPLFLFGFLASNLVLLNNGTLYFLIFTAQAIFYLVGIIGLFMSKQKLAHKFLDPIVYFCMINFAASAGLYRYLSGRREIFWETAR